MINEKFNLQRSSTDVSLMMNKLFGNYFYMYDGHWDIVKKNGKTYYGILFQSLNKKAIRFEWGVSKFIDSISIWENWDYFKTPNQRPNFCLETNGNHIENDFDFVKEFFENGEKYIKRFNLSLGRIVADRECDYVINYAQSENSITPSLKLLNGIKMDIGNKTKYDKIEAKLIGLASGKFFNFVLCGDAQNNEKIVLKILQDLGEDEFIYANDEQDLKKEDCIVIVKKDSIFSFDKNSVFMNNLLSDKYKTIFLTTLDSEKVKDKFSQLIVIENNESYQSVIRDEDIFIKEIKKNVGMDVKLMIMDYCFDICKKYDSYTINKTKMVNIVASVCNNMYKHYEKKDKKYRVWKRFCRIILSR